MTLQVLPHRTELPAWTSRPQVTNGHPLLRVINHSAIRLVRHLRRQLPLRSYIGNSIRRARRFSPLDGQVESPIHGAQI